jgi:hypothetical protein
LAAVDFTQCGGLEGAKRPDVGLDSGDEPVQPIVTPSAEIHVLHPDNVSAGNDTRPIPNPSKQKKSATLVAVKTLLALVVGGLVMTACGASDDTATTIASTAATTTTTGPTPTTTTTTSQTEVFLQVDQPLRLIVTMPEFVVSGTTSPGATVTVGDVETTAVGDEVAFFQVSLTLDPGTSELIVLATDDAGTQATAFLSITYLPDATEEFAFLTGVGPDAVVADYADFLMGDEANEAAVEAGVIEPGDSVPNDYFIRNVNPQLRTLRVDGVPVVVLPTGETGPVTDVAVPFDEWLDFFDDGHPWPEGESPDDSPFFLPGAAGTPYWLTIQDGSVVQIRQQYLP